MAYDLILRTRPAVGRLQTRTAAAFFAREVAAEAAIASRCEVTEGPAAASEIDTVTLQDALEEEFSEAEFHKFCAATGAGGDVNNPESAAAFLDSKWGVLLTCVKLPSAETEARAAYAGLVAFAKEHGIRLVDPQAGVDMDLDAPGELPPMWR